MTTRCVLVCGSFMPREGGAERQMRSVLVRLDAEGVETTVVTQVLDGQPRGAMVPGTGVAIERVGSGFAFRRFPRIGQALFLMAALARVISLRPATVVSLQFGSASAAASLAARAVRSRHVVRLTGGGTSAHRSEPFVRASSRLGRLLVRLISAGPDVVVVAPAQHLLDDFQEAFPQARVDMELVPNGVDPLGGGRLEDRLRRGVVWYARGGAEQSVAFFLSVAAGCPEVPFYVVGQPVDVDDVPNVQSSGWCEDVYPVLRRARILLNTSKTEGSPNMALQAISSGCHVLGAENAGISELVNRYPRHVHTYPWVAPDLVVCRILTRLHAQESPGMGVLPTSENVFTQWHELLLERGRT